MSLDLDLDQLQRQAEERARERSLKLAEAQFELAQEHGFPSWPTLKTYLEAVRVEHPFRTDLEYYEGRADGIATTSATTVAQARRELAIRHGFKSWRALAGHLSSLESGAEPPTPFMQAYRAVEEGDGDRLTDLLDRHPELVRVRGTNGNDLLGMANGLELVRLLLERGADPLRGNDYGWTKLHQAGYSNNRALAELMIAHGARTDLSARGDGGTPLVVALFWGHRDVVELLGLEPGNLRVAAGLGKLDLIRELVGTSAAGAHRGFYRPHGGFPAWEPSEDPQQVLDEALAWAARSDRGEAIALLLELGARIDADLYRGTALAWAAANGRVNAIRTLVEHGADPNQLGTFGGGGHGSGVAPIHLAAQAGRREAVEALLDLGADWRICDGLHDSNAAGWASFGGHPELAALMEASR